MWWGSQQLADYRLQKRVATCHLPIATVSLPLATELQIKAFHWRKVLFLHVQFLFTPQIQSIDSPLTPWTHPKYDAMTILRVSIPNSMKNEMTKPMPDVNTPWHCTEENSFYAGCDADVNSSWHCTEENSCLSQLSNKWSADRIVWKFACPQPITLTPSTSPQPPQLNPITPIKLTPCVDNFMKKIISTVLSYYYLPYYLTSCFTSPFSVLTSQSWPRWPIHLIFLIQPIMASMTDSLDFPSSYFSSSILLQLIRIVANVYRIAIVLRLDRPSAHN